MYCQSKAQMPAGTANPACIQASKHECELALDFLQQRHFKLGM